MEPRKETGRSAASASKKPKKGRMNGFEEWGGYMAAKKTKLNAQFENRKPVEIDSTGTQVSNMFDGISIYVNGYTKPCAEELKRLMMLHGGKYHYYYSATQTSYMVATNLPDSKIKSLKDRKIVLPNWITDSIKAGRRLPDTNYLLYTPEITDRQHRLQLTKQNVQQSLCLTDSSMNIVEAASGGVSLKDSTIAAYINQELVNTSELISSSSTMVSPRKVGDSLAATSNISLASKVSPDKSVAITAGHPDFISEFYNRSRLHHISTAGQELKLYVQQLASELKGKPLPGREMLRTQTLQYPKHVNVWNSSSEKSIMHLDIDCFFVSVGLKNHPELRGQPVAVTHSKGKRGTPQPGSSIEYEANYYSRRLNQNASDFVDAEENATKPAKISTYSSEYGSLSEVASCSYEAREAGVKNGMFLGEAMRLCPGLKTIPYDFDGYSEVSKQLYDIVASYTLDIEAVSCDELYIDCTELLQDVKMSASDFSTILRNEIFKKTGCTASAGVGKNMLLARLATKVAKPNGQYILPESDIMEFMKKQGVKDLPGVGYSISAKLKQLGIKTCEDLQNCPLSTLQQEFGPKTGHTLFEHCRGLDGKTVTLEKDRKSVSAEINYGIRFEEECEIYKFINELAVEVQQRLKKIDRKGRSLTLKLRIRKEDAPMQTAKFMGHGVCDSICKSTVLKIATDDSKIIGQECCSIARSLMIKPQDYRGIGIQLSKLESTLKDPNVKTMEHFLSKTENNDNRNSKCIQPIQVPEASSSTDIDQSNDRSEPQNIPDNASVQNPLTQSAYYAQISEMDQSVLGALPEDLRQEILSACSSRRENVRHQITSNAKVVKSSTMSRRGRPAGAKTKKVKLPKESSPQKIIKEMISNNTAANVIKTSTVASRNQAHLGGATEINEVRGFVKEWVLSTKEPADEDIEHFKNYLIQLVEEDLEKLDLVLKQFHRLASSANLNWKDTYFLILSYVQQKMLQDIGYMLKVRDTFD